jgi:hypothetical protein
LEKACEETAANPKDVKTFSRHRSGILTLYLLREVKKKQDTAINKEAIRQRLFLASQRNANDPIWLLGES